MKKCPNRALIIGSTLNQTKILLCLYYGVLPDFDVYITEFYTKILCVAFLLYLTHIVNINVSLIYNTPESLKKSLNKDEKSLS